MSERTDWPTISVVMPMFNAAAIIERVLAPLEAMLQRGELLEILIVDDGSTDDSAAIVRRHPSIQLHKNPQRGGPGAARNFGARLARGDYLWFVDSDVVVCPDAAVTLRTTFAEQPLAAVMGMYDDTPAATNFLSQYKNLVHHYYHNLGNDQASTFWAGCGAVNRKLFLDLDGFDAKRFRQPSIEDIDLGYRIRAAGGEIRLLRHLQGKHLKEWRLRNLIHTEVFRRALPWSRLMLERREITNDLNVGTAERVRAAIAGLAVLALLSVLAGLAPWQLLPVAAIVLIAANFSFFRFFLRHRGVLFALAALGFHQIYYLYSSATFAFALLEHLSGVRARRPAEPLV